MAALFCSQNLTTWGSLHMGVWKQRGLEVKKSRGLDIKPCRHLNVYVSGRLDVHHPCDPPCRGGLALVIAPFLFAQNPTKRWYNCFACGFARHNPSVSPSASQILSVPFSFTICFFLLRLAASKNNLRFFSDQLSLNIH